MDARAVRTFIDEHPDGVAIHMIDGTMYAVPGRDWLWLTPDFPGSGAKTTRTTTSFYLFDEEAGHLRLVNALLVRELHALKANGTKKTKGRRRNG